MRVMIIGLDCAPPALVFERWARHLPHLSGLRERGAWGPLRSTEPPITVPAWASMTSGRDPGELGLYGFRNMGRDRNYRLQVATSADVKVKRLWDRASNAGLKVASLFVPLTHPPTPVRGTMVSCFLTPPDAPWVFPTSRAADLSARFGEYHPDVRDFRTDDLARVMNELDAMRDQHFAMARHIWVDDSPDFLMMVEMGPDRLHHAAWHHFDPQHSRYEAGNEWERRALDYYVSLDAEIGRLVALAPDACVMVVSDHGAKEMKSAAALNELLIRTGWLKLKTRPSGVAPLRDHVDWPNTRAWAEGGYYARVFLNVRGRESEGLVPLARLAEETTRLALELEQGLAEHGVHARCVRPSDAYREVRGQPPDLMVYLNDLDTRALGTVGHPGVVVAPSETGVDGCNHDWDGIFVAAGPGIDPRELHDASILDVAPTTLARLALPHDDLRGRDLLGSALLSEANR